MPPVLADRRVWLAAATAALVRLGLAAAVWQTQGATALHDPDTASYRVPAKELMRHGTFTVQGGPEIVRTPGYPLLLALGLAVGNVTSVTVLLQVALSTATVLLTGWLAAELFVSRRGDSTVQTSRDVMAAPRLNPAAVTVAAAALMAIEPLSVIYSVKLTSETLFTALYAFSVVCLVRHLRQGGTATWLASAAALAAAVYVRPIAYFLPLVNAAVLLAAHGRRGNATRLKRSVGYLLVCAALVAPWQVRNWRQAQYGRFSAIGDVTRYFYTAAGVWAAQHGQSYYDVQDEWGYRDAERYAQRHPDQQSWTFAQRLAWMRGEAHHTIRQYPLTAARLHVRGVALAATEPGTVEFLRLFGRYPREGRLLGKLFDDGVSATLSKLRREQPLVFWSSAAGTALLLALYALAAVGWFRLPAAGDAAVMLVVLHAAYFLAAAGGPQAVGRFRHPVMPLICALAGIGLAALWRSWPARPAMAKGRLA